MVNQLRNKADRFHELKELLFYMFGCFSGIFLMCALQLAKKSDEVYIKKSNKK